MRRRAGDPIVTVVLVVVPVVTVVVMAIVGASPDLTGDVALYRDVSARVLRGEVPYRDFDLEYPILSIVPMLLPRFALGSGDVDLAAYDGAFVLMNAALTGLLALVLGRFALVTVGRPQRVLALFALLIALTAHLVAWRYDVAPALLSSMGLLALVLGRPTLAGGLIGVGIATKLYPAVLVPIGLVWLLGQGRRSESVSFASAATAAAVVPFLPLVLLAPDATTGFLAFQAGRGFQIESVTAGLLELGSMLGVTPVGIEFAFKTYQVTSPLIPLLVPLQAVVTVGLQLALAALMWLHIRTNPHADRSSRCLVAFSLAALVAFMVTNKVLSPQHLVWVVAIAPMIAGRAVPLLVAGAAAISVLVFPMLYEGLIGLDPAVVVMVNARNAMLVGVLVALLLAHPPQTPKPIVTTAPAAVVPGR